MKKISTIMYALLLIICFSFCSFAEEANIESDEMPGNETVVTEAPQDMSTPRLMVTDYKLSTDSLKPGENAELAVTLKNYSNTKALFNIKLSVFDESGDIETQGMPTAFVAAIYAGSTYVWKIKLSASQTAQIGQHKLTVTSEYEDKYYSSYSSSDLLKVNVTQSVGIDWLGLALPVKVVQGETETLSISLMNTGKTDLRNCKVDFEIDGLSCGGTVFVGEIPAGESKESSCNLRVSSEKLGNVSGEAVISYEDIFGKKYTKRQTLETLIVEKVAMEELQSEEKDEKKNPLWWIFLLIGVAVGGGIGCAIPIAVYSGKQRKEDEMRL